jgi:hypothetical protein
MLVAACSSPPTTTISDMPASTVASVDGSADAEGGADGDVASDGSDAGPEGVLSIDGAFDPATGSPLRILVNPAGTEAWHWVDAQTGEYVGAGAAPEPRGPFDRSNVVGATVSLPDNCEGDGSGLQIRVGPVSVQQSGRFIAAESVHEAVDCSDDAITWRGVAIDPATGTPGVRFGIADGNTAIRDLQYDVTGVWLLITLADGSLEWQGRSGRVDVEARDASGAVVAVQGASWGDIPPEGPVAGRVFVPTASAGDLGDPTFPAQLVEVPVTDESWSVVLAAASSPGDSGVQRAVSAATAVGYEAVPTICDEGAAAAFGWAGPPEDADLTTVSVRFGSEAAAREAARLFELGGTPAVAALVRGGC